LSVIERKTEITVSDFNISYFDAQAREDATWVNGLTALMHIGVILNEQTEFRLEFTSAGYIMSKPFTLQKAFPLLLLKLWTSEILPCFKLV
jgi:hypothetical protein